MMIFYAVKGPIIRRHRSRGCMKRGRKPFEHLEEEHPKEEGEQVQSLKVKRAQ